jgi:phosphatidylglycerophosphatase C
MSLAFFDFDGTLTTEDTILPLGLYLTRTKSRRYVTTARLLVLMALLKGRVISNDQFKRRFCELLLKGETSDRVDRLCRAFADQYVQGILNEPIVRRLREHCCAGDEVYIVTSNFGFVLRALAQQLPADGVIATEPDVESGRYTGRLRGSACDGAEKLSRVVLQFGQERVRAAAAYGDSRGDRPLLEFVKTAVWV